MKMRIRRRDFIGIVAAGAASGLLSRALAKGDLPPGIAQLDGTALVNGQPAHAGTPVNLGDRISTGRSSQAVVVVRNDAFLLRAQTTIVVNGSNGVLKDMLVSAGQVLSVFAPKPVAIKAASASIGIRGTGCYIEVSPESVYFCLCYGEALVEGPGMADAKLVKTTHHEEPLILRDESGIMRAEPGPFRNHSDAELIMLEALVGREPPFMKDGTYPAKRY
jgi:hypothetical protein